MTNTLNDWTVKLGFDNSAVVNGIKGLDDKFSKFSAKSESRLKRTEQVSLKASKTLAEGMLKNEEKLAKQQINDRLHIHKITTQLDKKADRERRLMLRNAHSEALRMEDARSKGRGFGGSSRLKFISQDERNTQSRRISGGIQSAESAITALKGGSPNAESLILIEKYKEAISKLRAAETELKNAVTKNSGAYSALKNNVALTRTELSKLNAKLKENQAQFKLSTFAANGFTSSIKNMGRSYLSLFAIMGAGGSVVNAGNKFANIQNMMLLSSGSAQQSVEDMKYIVDMSKTMGVNLLNTAESFAKFSVAGKGAGLGNGQIKDNFKDLTVAIRATGLTTDRANLAFLAFQQMLAGPTLQAQEMNQANEQLPQFTGMAIKALREMGYEGENYKKIVESGTVDSAKFVSTITRLMREQAVSTGAYGKSLKTVTSQMGRLATEYDLLVSSFWASGGEEGIVNLLKGITSLTRGMVPLFRTLARILEPILSTIGEIFDIMSIMTTPIKMIIEVMSTIVGKTYDMAFAIDEATGKLGGMHRLFLGIAGIVNIILGSIEELGKMYEEMTLSGETKFDNPSSIVKSLDLILSNASLNVLETLFGKIPRTPAGSTMPSGPVNITINPTQNMNAKDIATETVNALHQQRLKQMQVVY